MKTIFIILLLIPSIAFAKNKHKESYYQKIDCDKRGGVMEYRLKNRKRVDCLTKEYAIEVDFVYKWYEGTAQALYYAMKTNRKAKLLVIVEKLSYERHIKDLVEFRDFYKLPLSIDIVRNY